MNTLAVGGASTLLLGRDMSTVAGNPGGEISGSGTSGQLTYWSNSSQLAGFPSVLNTSQNSIALGAGNTASGSYATVGGGHQNAASADYATVGGGWNNTASDTYATIAGGVLNVVNPGGSSATVGGGYGNTASNGYATIAGGVSGAAAGFAATIGGGQGNSVSGTGAFVGGGYRNTAMGGDATVAGGNSNSASNTYSTVPGGYNNSAAGYGSFAAGCYATVQGPHHGAIVFSDHTYVTSGIRFYSAGPDEFAVRAIGGARFVTAIDTTGKALTQMTVNSSGSLGVKNQTPQFDVHVIGTADPASVTVDGIGIVGPNFQFRRARGTASSPTAIMSGDGILFLVGKGYGSTGFSAGGRANVSMYATQNWTDTAQGTFMSFKTTASGTTTQAEKMRITDTGNILPPSDNTGNIGINGQRWALVRATTVTPGDLVFENGIRATEDGNGLAFRNRTGRKIAVLDEEGNWHIKGDVIKDL